MIKQLTLFLFAAVAVHWSIAQDKSPTKIVSSQVEHYLITDGRYKIYYTGAMSKGKPEGKGKAYDLSDNLVFEGDFVKGNFSNGISYRKGKLWREGSYSPDGHFTGYGKVYNEDGRIFLEGNFEKGELQGSGKKYYPNGDTYEGEFREGIPNGQGSYYNATTKSKSVGWFYHIFRSGQIYLNDGSRYAGDLKTLLESTDTGNMGNYYFANGDVYKGEFRNRQMNGQGTYTWKNGAKHFGIFHANQSQEASPYPLQIPFRSDK